MKRRVGAATLSSLAVVREDQKVNQLHPKGRCPGRVWTYRLKGSLERGLPGVGPRDKSNPCSRKRSDDPEDNVGIPRWRDTHQGVALASLATTKIGQRERYLSGQSNPCPWEGPGPGILHEGQPACSQTTPLMDRCLTGCKLEYPSPGYLT